MTSSFPVLPLGESGNGKATALVLHAAMLVWVLVGCAKEPSHPQDPSVSAESYIARMEKLDTGYLDSKEATEARIVECVRAMIDEIVDPTVIEQVILRSQIRRKTYYQDRTTAIINPFALSILWGLKRLSVLGTDESIAILVSFMNNESTRWGGEIGEMHFWAIAKCGKSAIPYLRTVTGPREADARDAKELIDLIEAGKLYE